MKSSLFSLLWLFPAIACAQSASPAASASAAVPEKSSAPKAADTTPPGPAVLPGRGLAQHDFFYAGEAKDERMFIVRGGQVVWSYTHDGKGEISDAVLMPNGNILFAHQYGITEVTAEKKVVWNHDAPPKTEIHTAQPIGVDRRHEGRLRPAVRDGDRRLPGLANRGRRRDVRAARRRATRP